MREKRRSRERMRERRRSRERMKAGENERVKMKMVHMINQEQMSIRSNTGDT